MLKYTKTNPLRCRSIWISDIHLGTQGCRADYLLAFLRASESEYLYLVGDIIDVWSMRRGVYWPQEHNNVIRTILGKAKKGTRVVYIPGNHDEVFREYNGMSFGNVEIHRKTIHHMVDGRKLLVLHGDEFDGVVQCSRFLALLGSRAYALLLKMNQYVHYFRRRLGLPYWSLAAYLKHRVKNAVNFISDFEKFVSLSIKKENVDGLVCGHIHHAEIRRIENVLYCNDGDWVESCTALIETYDGGLNIMHWSDEQQTLNSENPEEAIGIKAA